MTAAHPQRDQDRPSRPLSATVLARLRAEKMYDDPAERRRFLAAFRAERRKLRAGGDTYPDFSRAAAAGDSILISAIVEAESSLRSGPRVL